jgi:toxin ParE1/3/4
MEKRLSLISEQNSEQQKRLGKLKQYIITPEASQDLNEISTYYEINNIEAGEKFIDEFEARCKYLVSFPNIGRSYSTIHPDLRGISFLGYIMFYRANDSAIEILRVVSGNRNWEALFADF